jgi:ABC-type glycerol-3-phosphate transport system substrate-binding protein
MRKAALCTAWVALLFGLMACSPSSEVTELSMFHWDFELDKTSLIYTGIAGRLGIDINPLTAPWTEWPGKLNVMIASGAVPDIFVTYGPGDPDSFERLARDGLLLPLLP